MKSKTYTVSWDEVIQNTYDIEKQLQQGNHAYQIYNVCNKPVNKNQNWQDAEKVRYYGHFYNALKDFTKSDYDIFIFNSGDPETNQHSEATTKTEELFANDPDTWVYAPNFTDGDGYNGDNSKIVDSTIHQGLYLSLQTNGIWIALRKELAQAVLNYYEWALKRNLINFQRMHSGWGIDYVYCSIAIYSNKKIYRDSTIIMGHKANNSSYDAEIAAYEMWEVINNFKTYVEELGLDKNRIQRIYDMTDNKSEQGNKIQYTIRDVYGKDFKA